MISSYIYKNQKDIFLVTWWGFEKHAAWNLLLLPGIYLDLKLEFPRSIKWCVVVELFIYSFFFLNCTNYRVLRTNGFFFLIFKGDRSLSYIPWSFHYNRFLHHHPDAHNSSLLSPRFLPPTPPSLLPDSHSLFLSTHPLSASKLYYISHSQEDRSSHVNH